MHATYAANVVTNFGWVHKLQLWAV